MDKSKNWSKSFLTLAALLFLVFAAACAEVRLNTIPAPPPTAKLRVYVQPLTTDDQPLRVWKMPHHEFARILNEGLQRLLQETGIYEVVKEEELKSVLGGKFLLRTDWARNDWALAKQVGKGLHADYALIVERSIDRGELYWEMLLINVETEKKFRILVRVPRPSSLDLSELQRMFIASYSVTYREIFRDGKADMLSTAIRKGRLIAPDSFAGVMPVPEWDRPPLAIPIPSGPPKPVAEPAPHEKHAVVAKPEPAKIPPAPLAKPEPSPAPVDKVPSPPVSAAPKTAEVPPPRPAAPPAPIPPKEPIPSPTIAREVDLEKALQVKLQAEGQKKLAVYDFEAIEAYKIVALILSEALREELFKLGLFHLVNRENIVKVLEEMALQQTGLVDEKEAVKAGKGLAAQQIVLGRYGVLGKTSVLQAKRVDVETQGALGLGSLRCAVGQEDELLQRMTDLAREIAGGK